VWGKKFPNALEIVQQKFSLNAPKPSHKKGFKTHFKQKKTRKDPQPAKLDFQNSNHLHDLGHNAKGQLTISYMLAKLFARKVDSNLREMKNNCLIIGMN
jgi:hypothetical protein